METTNSTSTNETYFETTKLINQWNNDVTSTMMDLYKKQLNMVSGFYSNLFNSFGGSNHIFNPMKNFTEIFTNFNTMKSKGSFFTGSGVNSEVFNSFDKTFQQLADYNQNLIQGFTKKMENGNVDWSSFNEKFKQTLEKEFEASQKLINTMMESYNKKVETSIDINKNLQKEFSEQINQLFKMNQQLWSETLNNKQNQPVSEKFEKNGSSTDVKKNAKESVHN